MLIEAIGVPFVCRWPGGECHIVPGQPVELPDDRAQRLMAKAPGRVRAVRALTPTIHAIQPGDQISWMQVGQRQIGVVDFLHRDPDGQDWAFVTIGGSWAAVNLPYARVMSSS